MIDYAKILERAKTGEKELTAFLVDLRGHPLPLRQGRAGHGTHRRRNAPARLRRGAHRRPGQRHRPHRQRPARHRLRRPRRHRLCRRPGPVVLRSVPAPRHRRQGLGAGHRRPEGRAGQHGLRRAHHPGAGPGPRFHPALHRHRAGGGLRRAGLEIPGRGGEAQAGARRPHRADQPQHLPRPPRPHGDRGRGQRPELPRLGAGARRQRHLQDRPHRPGDREAERDGWRSTPSSARAPSP